MNVRLKSVSKQELFDLLFAAVDGIDGYESETGYLRYWNESKINRARQIIDSVAGDPVASPASRDPESDIPRQQ